MATAAGRVTDVDVLMSGCTNFEGSHLMLLLLSDYSWLFFGITQLLLIQWMLLQAYSVYFQLHVEEKASTVGK